MAFLSLVALNQGLEGRFVVVIGRELDSAGWSFSCIVKDTFEKLG